eukprot:SAG11_NODE_31806_length_288_cov_362.306878_1_plen_86_part_01
MEEATPKKKKGERGKAKTPSLWDKQEPNEFPTRIWNEYKLGGKRTWGKYTPCHYPDGTAVDVWEDGSYVDPMPQGQYPIDDETGVE